MIMSTLPNWHVEARRECEDLDEKALESTVWLRLEAGFTERHRVSRPRPTCHVVDFRWSCAPYGVWNSAHEGWEISVLDDRLRHSIFLA